MEKPDAEEFARNVMWHLTWLRAELYATRRMVAEILSQHNGQSVADIEAIWLEKAAKEQESIYLQAMVESKIHSGLPDEGAAPPEEEIR
jgi:hypothetical protein